MARHKRLRAPGDFDELQFEAEQIVRRAAEKTPMFQRQIKETKRILVKARKDAERAMRKPNKK